jgi:hypothetical protein
MKGLLIMAKIPPHNLSPVDLIEHGCVLACEKHEETHRKWRILHYQLMELRHPSLPYDAGDHDARFDTILRELEDDQLRHVAQTGTPNPSPHARTRFQIQLTRYWISSTYELFRTTHIMIPDGNPYKDKIKEFKLLLAAYRMPIAKQAPHTLNKPLRIEKVHFTTPHINIQPGDVIPSDADYFNGIGTYRVSPSFDTDTGSFGFIVYDHRAGKDGKPKGLVAHPRREISDMILSLSDDLPPPSQSDK